MAKTRRTFLWTALGILSALLLVTLPGASQDGMGSAKFLNVKGIKTRYFEAGSGPNLVLIHGGQFGSDSYSADVWSLNFQTLSQDFHVFAFDKLGQGFTDNPASDEAFTMEAVMQHCLDFIETAGIRKVSLLGHSRGALPAARTAIDRPELIEKLILLDSNTLAPSQHSDFYTKLHRAAGSTPTLNSVRMEPDANSFSNHHVSPEYVSKILQIAQLPKTAQIKAKMHRLRPQFIADVEKARDRTLESIRNGELKAPTLIVWGFNDPSAPFPVGVDLMKIFSASVPQTRFYVFNQAGHYLFREKAKIFNRLVKEFLLGP